MADGYQRREEGQCGARIPDKEAARDYFPERVEKDYIAEAARDYFPGMADGYIYACETHFWELFPPHCGGIPQKRHDH